MCIRDRYLSLQPNKSGTQAAVMKQKEGELILNKLKTDDYLILLDERGRAMTSIDFAAYLEKLFQHSSKRIIFASGGAYGFAEEVRQRANATLSLSPMTFSHRLIRLLFLEQLYRAMTIIHKHPYHNE